MFVVSFVSLNAVKISERKSKLFSKQYVQQNTRTVAPRQFVFSKFVFFILLSVFGVVIMNLNVFFILFNCGFDIVH